MLISFHWYSIKSAEMIALLKYIPVYRRESQFITYNIYFPHITSSAKMTLSILATTYLSSVSDSCHIQVDRTECCEHIQLQSK